MKKTISLLLILVMLLCLGGCATLSSLRQTQAIWKDNYTAIEYLGEEYRFLCPADSNLNPPLDDTRLIYATEADVPLLLVNTFGAYMDISKDGRFLIGSPANEFDVESIYCRTDCYEQMLARVGAEFVPESYYYTYYREDYQLDYYQFSSEQCALIDDIFASVTPLSVSESQSEKYGFYGFVDACSQDLLFSDYGFEVWEYNGYHLAIDKGAEGYLVYAVPADKSSDFEQAIKYLIAEAELEWMDAPSLY